MATDTANPETEQAASANGAAPEAAAAAKTTKPRNGVYVQTPKELRERLEAEAKAQGVSPAAYVQKLLAGQWGISLPAPRSRAQYASEDEKKAAQTARRKARADLVKKLLADYEAKQQAEAQAATAAA